MITPKLFKLGMPLSEALPAAENPVANNGVVVIVGANGSGKTRLGTWIEFSQLNIRITHRISAQKSLRFPSSLSTTDLDAANIKLYSGIDINQYNDHDRQIMLNSHQNSRAGNRWGHSPNNHLLDDYKYLLEVLFIDHYNQAMHYKQNSYDLSSKTAPPTTRLDKVKLIWESVLPHRELIISVGKIEAVLKGAYSEAYSASELSDGERVIFYLIGECLAAPENGILIIDEPELHLHKSLQSRLWDAIEAERKDCQFVYLTHDLEFAASRVGAKKIWLKSYDGQSWDWREVPEDESIPEEAMLEIVGSRKPILFVEGEKGSLDYFIYSHAYPDFSIIPLGSCQHVISATSSFSRLNHLHDLHCFGIIDRDFRSQDEIAQLHRGSIHVLDVSEIENVLLIESVVQAVADIAMNSNLISDSGKILQTTKALVLNKLNEGKQRIIPAIAAARVESMLARSFDAKASNRDKLINAVNDLSKNINPAVIYDAVEAEIEGILLSANYDATIRLYNNKGLLPEVARIFGMDKSAYVDYIKRLITNPENNSVRLALQRALPSFT